MAAVPPLVRVSGRTQRLQAGDSILGLSVARLSSTQTSLPPGDYDLDTSGGAFDITLSADIGAWRFGCSNDSTGTSTATIKSTGGVTFTNAAGAQVNADFLFDMADRGITILHTDTSLNYRVIFNSNGPATTTPVARLSATNTALAPGFYDIDTSGGAFELTPTDVVGAWVFGSSNRSVGTTPMVLKATGGRTYTNEAGVQVNADFNFNIANKTMFLLHAELGTAYRVLAL
jgi:hypothetical protein